ncbi:MAG: hypothetical protein HS113_28720 [Verrucomicrobiales bacterium]|nr:hypothetical protein [Verrucomicrobiales bacterium]
MPPSLAKSFWLSVAALALLAGLLLLTLPRLGGRVPALKPLSSATNGVPDNWLAFREAERWFRPLELTRLTAQTNVLNPFFTLHFQPPPPPSTKTVELTYLGFLASSEGLRRAFVQIDDATRVFSNGATVVANHAVQDIARRTLVLTNADGRTNVLEFRVKKALQIPLR